MNKMKTAVFSACVLMAAGGAFAQTKDSSDATKSQGSPGDIKSQAAPNTMQSGNPPGGATSPTGATDRTGAPQGSSSATGTTGGTTSPSASDSTKSQGSPGDLKSQMAPGTTSNQTSPGNATMGQGSATGGTGAAELRARHVRWRCGDQFPGFARRHQVPDGAGNQQHDHVTRHRHQVSRLTGSAASAVCSGEQAGWQGGPAVLQR